MAIEIDDGGPAWPVEWHDFQPETGVQVVRDQWPGMSLRDYFAAKAMQSIFAGVGAQQVADRDERYDETNWKEIVADNAYEMADAMLAERIKK